MSVNQACICLHLSHLTWQQARHGRQLARHEDFKTPQHTLKKVHEDFNEGYETDHGWVRVKRHKRNFRQKQQEDSRKHVKAEAIKVQAHEGTHVKQPITLKMEIEDHDWAIK